MRFLRAQYFLAYAIMGSILPYISVYLAAEGLDDKHIGYIQAVGSIAVMLTPVLVTLLADTHLDARRIMAAAFILSGATLLAIPFVHHFWPLMALWLLHNLAYVPILPLQDGINFSLQEQRKAAGLKPAAYHRIRVFGTIGFIAPGIVLYFLFRGDRPIAIALWTGAAVAVVGFINTLFLPDPQLRKRRDPAAAMPAGARMPTVQAARAMLRPPLLVFCMATFLLNAAVMAYYTYYPIYLTRQFGLDRQWLAPVYALGVVVEIGFMLSFGRAMRKFGLRGVMLGGVGCIVLRMLLLAIAPVVWIAIGAQVLHGAMVLVLQVMPPVFLNDHAEDRWRHSMQGIYTMLIVGLARITGNLALGPIAQWSKPALYAVATAVAVVAMGLVLMALAEAKPHVATEVPEPASGTE